MKKFFIVFLTVFLFFVDASALTNKKTVTIDILSKQIRLIKQRINKEIKFLPSRTSRIHLISEGRIITPCEFSIVLCNGKPVLVSPEFNLTQNFKLAIVSEKKYDSVRVRLDSEERLYPLPVNISFNKNKFTITAEENISRYSLHSANAEYGRRYESEKEAVFALAQLIMARTYFLNGRKNHNTADFCDLTHCQVYRGILNYFSDFNDNHFINIDKYNKNLFFNSCCGGKIFTADVFRGSEKFNYKRDWLFHSGTYLCKNEKEHWQKTIPVTELFDILNFKDKIKYNTDIFSVKRAGANILIKISGDELKYPLDTFRIRINRKKGWNFIRSNNYRIDVSSNLKTIEFRGWGLGHGVGFCQKGALQLSRMGYNRFEILKHYYPDLEFMTKNSNALSPLVSYVIFNTESGELLERYPYSILSRKIVPGSFFKLFTVLYLAHQRPDLFSEYTYDCRGNSQKKDMPKSCWDKKGHGKLKTGEALAKSCNLFFASLQREIDFNSFKSFIKRISAEAGIDIQLPETKDKISKAKLLSGLDFRMSISVKDMIKVLKLISPTSCNDKKITGFRNQFPEGYLLRINNALRKTFTAGTASVNNKETKSTSVTGVNPINQLILKGIWGKTSTVIDGTNKPVLYGMFAGGIENIGIICILRNGCGHNSSKLAVQILSGEQ